MAFPASQPPRKKPKRDPNMPRKPPSAFSLYCSDKRNELKQQQPDLKTGPQIQTALGMAWRAPRMLSTRGSVHETQIKNMFYVLKYLYFLFVFQSLK